MTATQLLTLDVGELHEISGGGLIRNASGALVGTATGTVGGVATGAYKAATERNDWSTFGRGFSTGYQASAPLGNKLGRAAYDAVTGAFVNVFENWGK